MRAKESDLIHATVLVDTMLDEFEHFGDSLAVNANVNSFRGKSKVFDYPNTYNVYALQNSLLDFYQINQSVFEYFIFFDKSGIVISKTAAYTYEDFYHLYMHEEKYADYVQWYEYMKNAPISYGFAPMESYQYKKESDMTMNLFCYTRPLFMTDASDKSRIYMYMEEETLTAMLPALVEGGIQLIEDESGQVLYFRQDAFGAVRSEEQIIELQALVDGEKRNGEIRFEGEKYAVVTHVSPHSGFSYHMLLPRNVVNNRMFSSLAVLSVFILVGIGVGVSISYYMSVQSATPINDILRHISRETERLEGHHSVFSILKATFNHLVSTNSDLEYAIQSQRPYIRNAFINRLIYGNFRSNEEILKLAEHVGFPCKERVFGVVIFRFCLLLEQMWEEDSKMMSSCFLSLIEVIEKELPDSLYTNLNDEQVVLLFSIPKERVQFFRRDTEESILRVKKGMPSSISEKLFAYGGNVVETLGQVYESYQNASYMFLDEGDQIENAVIWHKEIVTDEPIYPPQDLTVKLIHFVTVGDCAGLHDALAEIMKKYIIENNLSVYLQQMLLSELQATLYRIIGRMGMSAEDYKRYYALLEENHNAPLIAQVTSTLNLYRQVCDYADSQKQQGASETVASVVISYIDANFGDSNLSLTTVADQFQISEPYLSSVFKHTQGINFSTYVETVRIDKAKDFLKTTSLSISKIAELVGYGSANSFCRAFKRVTGLNASEYRKK